jgi:SAM-dependent methyltransferase
MSRPIDQSPELSRPPLPPPDLNEDDFQPSEDDIAFLRASVSSDDAEIKRRVVEVAREAYDEYPYPCIRGFHFINLTSTKIPIYQEVLQAGKADSSAIFLDIGCCMGTDLRKIASDGYPANQLIGTDIRGKFWTLGQKLFQDASTSQISFVEADIFKLPSDAKASSETPLKDVTNLEDLGGRVTHIYTAMVFHLFDKEAQEALALRVATLLKRASGSVIFGAHQGLSAEGIIEDRLGRPRYGHSPASWETLWLSIFTKLESEAFTKEKVKITAALVDRPGPGGKEWHFLVWSIRIV